MFMYVSLMLKRRRKIVGINKSNAFGLFRNCKSKKQNLIYVTLCSKPIDMEDGMRT